MKKGLIILFIMVTGLIAQAQDAKPLTIENYYKIKWGHADEFIALWKKNHYPLLKKLQEKGDILNIKAEAPVLHSGEDTRWDFKVILTFKTEHLALDYSIVDPLKKQLYPDQEAYKKAEQARFELVVAHWDIPVETIPLN
ncbi:hypothetical protein SNE26_09630 [Mucilaginibacter sp. cycad4]|uniref:hypothetical protein n=1 Tax=Mucilaginibacter sp. cycad4 TaxID=3342096 RepID=UPI002AAC14C9|nr:hypothetical protein [Mucilaginibacter gossypii]WPV02034.1 hypothetical protein SNE26_09630 [Mucilaginibacter gossypii]